MTLIGWAQILLFCVIIVALTPVVGGYMTRVFGGERTFLSPILRPVEVALYRLGGVNEKQEQHWLTYTVAMLLFHVGGFILLYALIRFQGVLPFNPAGQSAVAPDLTFNTAISFITNTNWQNYGGEGTMSYLVQMLGLTHQNFLSAATGIALALALIRGFARTSVQTVGNFWVDITRCTLYVLLPLCILLTLVYVALGVPQTLGASVEATTLEGAKQTIAIGPVAPGSGDGAGCGDDASSLPPPQAAKAHAAAMVTSVRDTRRRAMPNLPLPTLGSRRLAVRIIVLLGPPGS